jgi:hypothetical protein
MFQASLVYRALFRVNSWIEFLFAVDDPRNHTKEDLYVLSKNATTGASDAANDGTEPLAVASG